MIKEKAGYFMQIFGHNNFLRVVQVISLRALKLLFLRTAAQ
jgi:hypothetical protein